MTTPPDELTATNPLAPGIGLLPPTPTALIVFGAGGDLAKRKLLPAVANLAADGTLPDRFSLIGVSRDPMPAEDFRAAVREAITSFSRREIDPAVLERLLERTHYVGGDATQVGTMHRLGGSSTRSPAARILTASTTSRWRRASLRPSSRRSARRAWQSATMGVAA